jgi:hypothetical protein
MVSSVKVTCNCPGDQETLISWFLLLNHELSPPTAVVIRYAKLWLQLARGTCPFLDADMLIFGLIIRTLTAF